MFRTLGFNVFRTACPSLSVTTPIPPYQYLRFEAHNSTVQKALWQRYTNSRLFLGDKTAEVSVSQKQFSGVLYEITSK
ncbi:MAG: hypothetical protein QXN16_03385 [Candidatus Micrarchaeaceae archaeon]